MSPTKALSLYGRRGIECSAGDRSPRRFGHFVLASMLGLLCWNTASAQLIVKLFQPPPNELRAADLWMAALTNPTKTTYTIYLHGTAVEVSNPSQPIPVVDAQTAVFKMPPGTKFVNGNQLSPIKVNSSNSTYQNVLTATGEMPTGNYQVCVSAIDAATGTVLGSDCYDQQVVRCSPPILIMPFDGSEVATRYPIFDWIAPAPLIGITPKYTLTIAQIYGQQSPYDAITSNPASFQASAISLNQFQYPVIARSLQPGANYAWKIDAFSARSTAEFSLGESEIWQFTYNPVDVSGNGTGVAGNGAGAGNNVTGGEASGNLGQGDVNDSITLYNYYADYFNENFFIPYGYDDLLPESVTLSDFGGNLDQMIDPNARNFVPNTPNDTTHGAACGRPPSLQISFQYPALDAGSPDWKEPFGIDWTVLHSQPIDHIDLQIALYGHEDAPLAHYIYRSNHGSMASATLFDPHPFILNTSADGMIIIVTAVAVDALGCSSGYVQAMYRNGMFSSPVFVISPPLNARVRPPSSDGGDSIVIRSAKNSGKTIVSPSRVVLNGGRTSVKFVNRDSKSHHYRSVYSPPYSESPALRVGGEDVLDFGEVAPGVSTTIQIPSGAPSCYFWTLYDMDEPDPERAAELPVVIETSGE